MTGTDTAGTALVQVAPGALTMVKGAKPWTLTKLLQELAPEAPAEPAAGDFPALPAVTEITPEVTKALRALPKVFGQVNMTERRALTGDEIVRVSEEAEAIKAVTTPLGARLTVISEMMRHHQDVAAEKASLAVPHAVTRDGKIIREATERVATGVAQGHYILSAPKAPYETAVPGFSTGWQQRFVPGKPVTRGDKLEALLEDGTITRQEYLAMTREVRTLDTDKVEAFVRKNPERGLAILGAITERAPATTSLYPPTR